MKMKWERISRRGRMTWSWRNEGGGRGVGRWWVGERLCVEKICKPMEEKKVSSIFTTKMVTDVQQIRW